LREIRTRVAKASAFGFMNVEAWEEESGDLSDLLGRKFATSGATWSVELAARERKQERRACRSYRFSEKGSERQGLYL